jgi:hypothetical protein
MVGSFNSHPFKPPFEIIDRGFMATLRRARLYGFTSRRSNNEYLKSRYALTQEFERCFGLRTNKRVICEARAVDLKGNALGCDGKVTHQGNCVGHS